jgi:hypothetical protein
VIRYSFLWSHEAKAGASEGRKDRPCAQGNRVKEVRDKLLKC